MNTEKEQGRIYSEQEQAELAIKTLQERYRQPFLDKSQKDLTNNNPSVPFPFRLKLCTIAATMEEWATDLRLQVFKTDPSPLSTINQISQEKE